MQLHRLEAFGAVLQSKALDQRLMLFNGSQSCWRVRHLGRDEQVRKGPKPSHFSKDQLVRGLGEELEVELAVEPY